MARLVQDREDLLRDAKALVPRVQFEVEGPESSETVFAGFRKQGALSLYFDFQPVYHFNRRGQLRRAYVEDRLIKAEAKRLIAMTPHRGKHVVEMLRHRMTETEQSQFRRVLLERLQGLKRTLEEGRYVVAGQVPKDAPVVSQLQSWLEEMQEITVAESPRVG